MGKREQQIKKWVAGTKPFDWYGMCAGLTMSICRHFGYIGRGTPYPSAWAAYLDTDIVSKDATEAPAGAIHYWDYYGRGSSGRLGRFGHVAVDIRGGGTHILSATRKANTEWGEGAGLISVKKQTVAGMTYMGWSRTYGAAYTVDMSEPAPPPPPKPKPTAPKPTPKPDPAPEKEEDDMSPIIIAQRQGNTNAAKARYVPGEGRIELLKGGAAEGALLRAAEEKGAVVFVDLANEHFDALRK